MPGLYTNAARKLTAAASKISNNTPLPIPQPHYRSASCCFSLFIGSPHTRGQASRLNRPRLAKKTRNHTNQAANQACRKVKEVGSGMKGSGSSCCQFGPEAVEASGPCEGRSKTVRSARSHGISATQQPACDRWLACCPGVRTRSSSPMIRKGSMTTPTAKWSRATRTGSRTKMQKGGQLERATAQTKPVRRS